MKSFNIGKHIISPDHPPFIIAEMSGNHNQSLERALEIVTAAAKAGAHAIKLQTYTADTMTIDKDGGEFYISDPNSLWKGESLYKLYKQASTPWEWHKPIFEKASSLGMECFSTPFDETAVDFLEELSVPCYKVASFENTHLPLIRKIAETGKPVIISTGMASLAELQDMVQTARNAGCENLVLLKCTSTYPAVPLDTNLNTIPHMRQMFDLQVGLSDHTMGIGAAIASVALGVCVIEKHFTLSRDDGGVDSAFSIEPSELVQLVVETHRAWQALGKISYEIGEKEKKSIQYRRSIYITKDIKKGELFDNTNLRVIRPGLGLAPKYFDQVLGKKAAMDLSRGTPLSFQFIDK